MRAIARVLLDLMSLTPYPLLSPNVHIAPKLRGLRLERSQKKRSRAVFNPVLNSFRILWGKAKKTFKLLRKHRRA
jgi:hypothetical protein